MADSETATSALHALTRGDHATADGLMALVYDELRAIAGWFLQEERAGHTLEPTALVHEAYLRMIDQSRVDWRDEAHFLAIAARMIRRVLVDHARRNRAQRRGGGQVQVRIEDDLTPGSDSSGLDLIDLDEVIEELGRLNERQRQVVELRFFGGLSVDQTALVLGVSVPTVKNDWRVARAWLGRRLQSG